MPRVVYHRLAANEFTRSGVYYERRRRFIGEAFVDAVEQVVYGNPEASEHWQAGKGRRSQP